MSSDEKRVSCWSDLKEFFSQDFLLTSYPLLRPLYIMFFLEIMGFSMTIPVMPFFIMEDLGLTATDVGIALSAFSCAQIFGASLIGRCSDAWGRRPVVIFCFLWASAGFIATAFVRNFTELLLARVLAGISGGTWGIVQAFVLDVLEPQDRGKYLGLLGGTLALAFAAGPGITAGLLATGVIENRRYIFGLAGCLCLVGCGIGACFLGESLTASKRRPLCGTDEEATDAVKQSDWEAMNLGLVLIWFSRFAVAFGQFGMYAMYGPLVKQQFGWSVREFGTVLLCSGLLGCIMQLFIFPAAVRSLGRHEVMILGAFLLGVGLMLLPVMQIVALHLLSLGIFGVGGGLVEPSFPNLVAIYASYSHLGFANGCVTSFRGFAAVGSPLAAGVLFKQCGGCAFYVGGGVATIACALILTARCYATEVEHTAEKGKGSKGGGKGSSERSPLLGGQK